MDLKEQSIKSEQLHLSFEKLKIKTGENSGHATNYT